MVNCSSGICNQSADSAYGSVHIGVYIIKAQSINECYTQIAKVGDIDMEPEQSLGYSSQL